MQIIIKTLTDTLLYVLGSLAHNALPLALGILVAAAMRTYIDTAKMRDWLIRRSSISIPATVAFGAFTPLCACGTMAVVLSMAATALPWGPIMAFLTSSPLMSPEGFILISGIISPGFAIALTVASIVIGLGSGYATNLIEKKTNLLKGQLRFESKQADSGSSCGCGQSTGEVAEKPAASCCSPVVPECGCAQVGEDTGACCSPDGAIAVKMPSFKESIKGLYKKYKIDELLQGVVDLGLKKILPLFTLFAAIGFIINRFIPSTWLTAVFGANNIFAVPLAAVIGLPLYVNGDSALPLIQSLMDGGVSHGAMMAFLITGPGTSAGVLAGITTIMKKKAVILYAAFLLIGAILLGYAYDLILTIL